MPQYLVTWEIDILDADNPREAAQKAWEHMRREDSTANVFDVTDPQGDTVRVDLSEEEGSDDDEDDDPDLCPKCGEHPLSGRCKC